jgi:hypothetical protein
MAILSSLIYDTLYDVIRKDRRGRPLSIEEYNNLSTIVNHSLFSDFYDKFEGNIESSDTLGGFKVFEYGINLTANARNTVGIGVLPANYFHIIGLPKTISGTPGTVRPVDIVTAQEHSIRIDDFLTQPTETYPICQIGGINEIDEMQIRVYPYTIATVYIDYLRVPDTPYLDYYINDTTLDYTYMASGVNVTVPLGSTYRDGTPGVTVQASLTVDWEFDEDNLELIIAKFLGLMGIQMSDEILLQAGALIESKKQVK